MRDKKKQLTKTIYMLIAIAFFVTVTVIMPFYYENQYFNMTEAKAHICYLLVCILVPVVLIVFIVEGIRSKSWKDKWNATDWLVCLFGSSVFMSCLLSQNVKAAFWGNLGWRVGACTLCGLTVFYFVLSRYLPYKQNLWLPVLIANVVIFLLASLHSMGMDALGIHQSIYRPQWYLYISTIGNINWYVGYLCLLTPVFASFFFTCTGRLSKILYGTVSILACMNVIFCASDGIYVGIGVCLFFVLPFIFLEERRVSRSGFLIAVYGGGSIIMRICPLFAEKVNSMSGIAKKMLEYKVSIPLLAVGIVVMLLAKYGWSKLGGKQIKWIVVILEFICVCAAILVISDAVSQFNDEWGSGRGLIWRTSWELFRSFPLKEKIFGVGPEMLRGYYQEVLTQFSCVVLTAHSEPLQLLLTTGMLGFLSWCGIGVSLAVNYVRDKGWTKPSAPFVFALMAYGGQSLVNSALSQNIALACVMLACLRLHDSTKAK